MLQLQSMVGVPERVDRYEPQYQTPLQPVMQSHMRPQDGYTYPNAAPVSATYSLPAQRRYDYYSNSNSASVTPNAPPSPPAEEMSKQKLPSISSLLEISDSKPGDQSQQQIHHVQQNHTQQPVQPIPGQLNVPVMSSQDYGTPESMSQAFTPAVVSGRMSLPSTPPLIPDGPMEGNQSPSTISTHSTIPAPPQTYYLSQQVAAVDAQSRGYSDAHIPKRLSITSQPTVHPYPTPSYTPTSQYAPTFVSSPTAMSAGPYYSENHVLPSSALYQQRPLPSNFPPPIPMGFAQPPSNNGSNPWQHHHYISPSSQSTFPPSQDRYVCQTCNKAFSRPSSLRIHTHSHTGEKPFKCSHAGCGKAFSVRSNMKRHERGCHAGTNPNVQHV